MTCHLLNIKKNILWTVQIPYITNGVLKVAHFCKEHISENEYYLPIKMSKQTLLCLWDREEFESLEIWNIDLKYGVGLALTTG